MSRFSRLLRIGAFVLLIPALSGCYSASLHWGYYWNPDTVLSTGFQLLQGRDAEADWRELFVNKGYCEWSDQSGYAIAQRHFARFPSAEPVITHQLASRERLPAPAFEGYWVYALEHYTTTITDRVSGRLMATASIRCTFGEQTKETAYLGLAPSDYGKAHCAIEQLQLPGAPSPDPMGICASL